MQHFSTSRPARSHHGHRAAPARPPPLRDEDIGRLAKEPQHQLRLADLVKHGWPPLSEKALLQSANFSLDLIPVRLARRLHALRNLPYIVVSNSNIRQIYDNYRHSLQALLPLWQRHSGHSGSSAVSTLDQEIAFTDELAELVTSHQNTIPILAQGFLESRKYISPAHVTAFLDEHLRARIGTRLIAEQHIALHLSSRPFTGSESSSESAQKRGQEAGRPPASYIGIIDTQLKPTRTIDSCAEFVADICELKYGVRPQWRIDGEPDTTFAYVPMHLEYIVTELLKNAFRAVVENRMHREPVVITIAPEPSVGLSSKDKYANDATRADTTQEDPKILPLDENASGVTIRIRDRGGGISADVLPNIWSYSFTTFSDLDDDMPNDGSDLGSGGLNLISSTNSGGSSIAGLGYGLPLSRAYAEYFGGGIAVQSLYGWGTDVYLRLKGVGNIG